jgi:hypothetical protein
MLNYKNCEIEDFTKAMNLKDRNVQNIPTNSLYVLYTKFVADSKAVRGTNAYTIGIHLKSVAKAEIFKNELIRRGILL